MIPHQVEWCTLKYDIVTYKIVYMLLTGLSDYIRFNWAST